MSKKNRKTRKQKENIQSKNLSPSPQGNTPKKKELTPEVIKARVDGMAKSLPVRLIQIDLTIYLFLLLVVQPLVYHNGFADIGTTKWNFYAYVSFGLIRSPFIIIIPGCLIIALGLWIWYAIACAVQGVFKEIFHPRNLTVPDWFVLGFMIFTVISAIQAPDKSVVLWGFPGWYMGMMAQLSFGWIYFLLSRFLRDRRLIIYAMVCAVTGVTIVSVIGLLNRCGIDALGLYETTWGALEEYEVTSKFIAENDFVSTIGNHGWYSAYLLVILPIALGVFYVSDRLLLRLFSGVLGAITMAAVITSGARSVIPGLAALLFTLFLLSCRSSKMLLRFLETVTLLFCATHFPRVVHLLHLKNDTKAVFSYSDMTLQSFVESSMTEKLTIAFLILTSALILILWLVRGHWKSADPAIGKAKVALSTLKWFSVCFMAVGLVGVICYIYLNTQGKLPDSLSSDSRLLNLNQQRAFGFRWRIWNTTWTFFTEEYLRHPLRLVFGMGPDSLYQLMMGEHLEELRSLAIDTQSNPDLYLTNAHNEWLTMWIDQGLFGILLYMGSFFTVFLRLTRTFRIADLSTEDERLKQILRAATSLAIAAYFAHNFFSYQQISAAPFIFVLMGLGMERGCHA